jgi:hypothetical protein
VDGSDKLINLCHENNPYNLSLGGDNQHAAQQQRENTTTRAGKRARNKRTGNKT